MKKLFASMAIGFLLLATASRGDDQIKDQDRLKNCGTVLSEIMNIPDNIPQDVLDKAQCVMVVPGLKKAAFVVGGEFGTGFVTCRNGSGRGWGAPAAIRMEGGSFGFQIGGSSTDLVMLVMNQKA